MSQNPINPFLQRTIEHWLMNTNELGYQMPFCQLLLSEGYSICHNSKQNAFEQGKDIIAIDPEGNPCGFQLKGGNESVEKVFSENAPTQDLICFFTPSSEYWEPLLTQNVINGVQHKLFHPFILILASRSGVVSANCGEWP